MNTKRPAICDSQGRPIDLFVAAGQVSDYIGARALQSGLPNVRWLLGNRGNDADWFREALHARGIRALRHVMFQAALVASHHDTTQKAFADRRRRAGKPHRVIVTAVARKLVIIANALCKRRQEWEPSHF